MNLKVKNTLIVTGTLIIGIIIGVLICGRFTQMKLRNLKNFYTEKGFKHQFISNVHPTPEQLKQLEPAFKKYVSKNRELIKTFREKRHENYLEFKNEAEDILSPEQMQRLQNLETRRDKIMRNKKPHFGNKRPPHHNKPF
jgi:uncharacterized membrane-anchored protein YhcB (DUF1043 family)